MIVDIISIFVIPNLIEVLVNTIQRRINFLVQEMIASILKILFFSVSLVVFILKELMDVMKLIHILQAFIHRTIQIEELHIILICNLLRSLNLIDIWIMQSCKIGRIQIMSLTSSLIHKENNDIFFRNRHIPMNHFVFLAYCNTRIDILTCSTLFDFT